VRKKSTGNRACVRKNSEMADVMPICYANSKAFGRRWKYKKTSANSDMDHLLGLKLQDLYLHFLGIIK